MALPDSTAAALEAAGIDVRPDAVLVKRTWWRTGGPADGLISADDLETLRTVRRIATETGCPLFVLGNASNLLISDRGIRGLVVRLNRSLAGIEADGDVLTAGGGAKLMVLTGRMVRNGWTGLEFFAGIPGTVGGAVRMNAGTSLGEVVDGLIDVEVVLADGTMTTLTASDLDMSYRTAHLPAGAIVASARFRLTDADAEASKAAVEHHLQRRKDTQPIDKPTCGSTFRNPPGDHAGRLIEAAGLKGFTIGGAQISPKHANFIVNLGNARADDIRKVIEHAQGTVRDRYGIELEREVHYAGDWG